MTTEEIIKRAKWLFAYNGGAIPLEECAKMAFNECENSQEVVQTYSMFGITRDMLLKDITKKVREEAEQRLAELKGE